MNVICCTHLGMSGFCEAARAQFCTESDILRRNLGSCVEFRKIYQMVQKMQKFC